MRGERLHGTAVLLPAGDGRGGIVLAGRTVRCQREFARSSVPGPSPEGAGEARRVRVFTPYIRGLSARARVCGLLRVSDRQWARPKNAPSYVRLPTWLPYRYHGVLRQPSSGGEERGEGKERRRACSQEWRQQKDHADGQSDFIHDTRARLGLQADRRALHPFRR